ncbi:MAG: LytTR family DNA-binding domain-containing protein [Oscillospiraceae bacterium]
MTFKVAVCDDDPVVRDTIGGYLARIESERGDRFLIQYYSNGEDCLNQLEPDTHVLFLDILMGSLSGIDVGTALRKRSSSVCIVFITSAVSYAVEGYRTRAFGFLEKPVAFETFAHELREALGHVVKQLGSVITMTKGFTTEQINTNDIIYLEVLGHHVRFVLRSGVREYTKPLKEIERQLNPAQFFKCHQSYVINLKYVVKIGLSEVLMANKQAVALSKHRKRELQEKFALYLGRPDIRP